MRINPINKTSMSTYNNKSNFVSCKEIAKNKFCDSTPSFKGNSIPKSLKKLIGASLCTMSYVVVQNPVTLILTLLGGGALFIGTVTSSVEDKNKIDKNKNKENI